MLRFFYGCIGLFAFSVSSMGVTVVPGGFEAVEAPSSNSFPFTAGINRYQQVYLASSFDDPTLPILIDSIAFRLDGSTGSTLNVSILDLEVRLSTTSITPETMSTTFASNIGGNETLVHDGPRTLTSSNTTLGNGTKAFDIIIPLSSSFLYNPNNGNLLLDITKENTSGSVPLDSDQVSTKSAAVMLRVMTSSGIGDTVGFEDSAGQHRGLVTQFTGTAIPEPRSVVLLSGCLVFSGVALRRFRKKILIRP
jgi:hypothetical protein